MRGCTSVWTISLSNFRIAQVGGRGGWWWEGVLMDIGDKSASRWASEGQPPGCSERWVKPIWVFREGRSIARLRGSCKKLRHEQMHVGGGATRLSHWPDRRRTLIPPRGRAVRSAGRQKGRNVWPQTAGWKGSQEAVLHKINCYHHLDLRIWSLTGCKFESESLKKKGPLCF